MGNMVCSPAEAAHLAAIARDICPFPSYEPSPHVFNMLFVNSSQHLADHYAAVQTSLTAQQLEGFTQSLRTTFGRKGKVTHGGVGVVALSLAILFDTLAGQMKGQWVPEEGPIPGLFVKNPKGPQIPYIDTVSEYLRLVPYIANNPTRMREEAERYFRRMLTERRAFPNAQKNNKDLLSDITNANVFIAQMFMHGLQTHLERLTNESVVAKIIASEPTYQIDSFDGYNTRNLFPVMENVFEFSFNCDADTASKEFLAKMQTSGNETLNAFNSCNPDSKLPIPKTWLHYIARLAWLDVINSKILYENEQYRHVIRAQMEDFDLKANSQGKWSD